MISYADIQNLNFDKIGNYRHIQILNEEQELTKCHSIGLVHFFVEKSTIHVIPQLSPHQGGSKTHFSCLTYTVVLENMTDSDLE